jgi:23S rRNA pseudouridine1911/1915/1917 synthase
MNQVIIDEEDIRIDTLLSRKLQIPRSDILEAIKLGFVLHKSHEIKPSRKFENGSVIDIDPRFYQFLDSISKKTSEIVPTKIDLDIIFSDENFAVINKQAGLVVHPGVGTGNNTLLNAIHYHFKIDNYADEIIQNSGIVHRLDKNTTGLMIIAKNKTAHKFISAQIQEKINFRRKYLAICYGTPSPASGMIENFVCKDPKDHTKMIIDTTQNESSRVAITHYQTVEVIQDGKFSIIENTLETGRTHQIRLHMLSVKHPILGDGVYKNNRYINIKDQSDEVKSFINSIDRQMLHSYYLSFVNINGKTEEFQVEIPSDMKKCISILQK